MSELILLPVKPGSLAEEDLQTLKDAGVTVIYHEAPETLRLIRPESDIGGSDLLLCAMRALSEGDSCSAQRQLFTMLVAAQLKKRADGH